jgi:hypothetical protein
MKPTFYPLWRREAGTSFHMRALGSGVCSFLGVALSNNSGTGLRKPGDQQTELLFVVVFIIELFLSARRMTGDSHQLNEYCGIAKPGPRS